MSEPGSAHEYEWSDALPTLPGDRIILRPITDADVPALFEVFSDREVMRYWSEPRLEVPADAAEFLQDVRDGFVERSLFEWGIALPGDDAFIGTCALHQVKLEHRRAEIGFAIGRPHWGRGFAGEAVGLLLDFAFRTVGLHRLEADVDPRNARSLRLLERHGFQREAYLRERYCMNGEVQDAIILGLLRPEWAALCEGERRYVPVVPASPDASDVARSTGRARSSRARSRR